MVTRQLVHHLKTAEFCLVQETKLNPLDKTCPSPLGGVVYHNNFPNPNKRSNAGTLIIVNNKVARSSVIEHTILIPGYLQMLDVTPKDPSYPPYRILNFYGQQTMEDRLTQVGCIESLTPVRFTFLGGDFNFKDRPNQTTGRYKELPTRFLSAWNRALDKHRLSLVPSDLHSFRVNARHTSQLDRFYSSYLESDHAFFSPLVSTPAAEEFKTLDAVDHRPMLLQFIPVNCKRRTGPFPRWLPKTAAFKSHFSELWHYVVSSPGLTTCPFKRWALFKETGVAAAGFALKTLNPTSPTANQKVAIAASALKELYSGAPRPSQLAKLARLDPDLPGLTAQDGRDPIPRLEAHLNALYAEFAEEPPDDPPHSFFHAEPNFLKEAKLFLPSKRNHLKGLVGKNGKITTDPLRMSHILKETWGKTWANRPIRAKAEPFLRAYTRRFPVPNLPMPTVENIQETIRQSGDSAAGIDGIPFSLYRELTSVASPLLHDVLAALCSGTAPPEGFNLSLGVFIPKVLDNSPENTRPIAMTNTDNRLLAKAVASYILPFLAETLSISQSAIIPGRDITDNIQAVTSAFYASLSRKSQMAVLLTDFTKAFDSLHHSYLFKVLKKLEFPHFFVNLVKGLLTEVGIIPTCCPNREVVIPVGQGVKQGCPLSPALFIIAIDPLLFFLEKVGITSKGFFDDVAVLSDRPGDIERALRLFQDFGAVSGLALNPRKTVLLTSLRPCRWITEWREEIKNMLPEATPDSLPLVEKATYLGALIGRRVTAEEIFAKALDKARARLHLYHPHREKLSVPKRVVVVNAFILPILATSGGFSSSLTQPSKPSMAPSLNLWSRPLSSKRASSNDPPGEWASKPPFTTSSCATWPSSFRGMPSQGRRPRIALTHSTPAPSVLPPRIKRSLSTRCTTTKHFHRISTGPRSFTRPSLTRRL